MKVIFYLLRVLVQLKILYMMCLFHDINFCFSLNIIEDEIPAHLRTEAKERRQRLIGKSACMCFYII